MPRLTAALSALALLLALAPAASADAIGATARSTVSPGPKPGVQRLHYEFGPVHITPGEHDWYGSSSPPPSRPPQQATRPRG